MYSGYSLTIPFKEIVFLKKWNISISNTLTSYFLYKFYKILLFKMFKSGWSSDIG
jgi:hypothetical protein